MARRGVNGAEEPNQAGRPRLRGFAGDHAGSLAVCITGAVLVVFSLVMYARQSKPEALGFTLLGVFCVVVGAVLPRVTEAAVSPQKFALKLSPAEQRAESVGLSLSGNPDDEKFDEPNELPVAARWYLAGEALDKVLTPGPEAPLHGSHVRLYLYDADRERLVPVLLSSERGDEDTTEEWAIGRGATGTAYARGDVVIVEGAAVWDTTYGLTEEQSVKFRHFTAVVSVPVMNESGDVIGVITGSATDPNQGGLLTEDGYYDLVSRSMLVARVLVDLLGWFPDRYDGPHGGD